MKSLLFPMVLFFKLGFASETGPCGKDGPKFCPQEKFGQGRMFECLVTQKDKLSKVCRNHIEKMNAYKVACEKEIGKFCQGKPFYCLYKLDLKDKDISNQCNEQIAKSEKY
jgi:hypothetical protein